MVKEKKQDDFDWREFLLVFLLFFIPYLTGAISFKFFKNCYGYGDYVIIVIGIIAFVIMLRIWDSFKNKKIKEQDRVIDLIKKDIAYQKTQLKDDFNKDKPIKWRIEGMNSLIKKIKKGGQKE